MDIKELFREEGRQAGMQAGIEKGRVEGELKNQQQVIRNMLKEKADLSFIAKVTGLSAREIKKLQNGNGRAGNGKVKNGRLKNGTKIKDNDH